jgi:hypothetical protein
MRIDFVDFEEMIIVLLLKVHKPDSEYANGGRA